MQSFTARRADSVAGKEEAADRTMDRTASRDRSEGGSEGLGWLKRLGCALSWGVLMLDMARECGVGIRPFARVVAAGGSLAFAGERTYISCAAPCRPVRAILGPGTSGLGSQAASRPRLRPMLVR